jgi:hypothetical protein
MTPALIAAALATVQYFGYFDYMDCSVIQGWVYQEGRPDITGIKVNIYFDGILSKSTVANLSRPDLVPYGYGEFHGFRTSVPASRIDGKEHKVSVKVTGTTQELAWSPKIITCNVAIPTPRPTPTPKPTPTPPPPTPTPTPTPTPPPRDTWATLYWRYDLTNTLLDHFNVCMGESATTLHPINVGIPPTEVNEYYQRVWINHDVTYFQIEAVGEYQDNAVINAVTRTLRSVPLVPVPAPALPATNTPYDLKSETIMYDRRVKPTPPPIPPKGPFKPNNDTPSPI